MFLIWKEKEDRNRKWGRSSVNEQNASEKEKDSDCLKLPS